jgi:hypothetical protein
LLSSSFLRHYDESKTLRCSIPLICLIGADGEHYHYAPDAATLSQVFREVANNLTELRLSK